MGKLLADIFVTIKPTAERAVMSVESLRSLMENTDRSQYRLTVCLDGENCFFTQGVLGLADYVLHSMKNEGLGPTINRAISHIKSVNDWYSDPKASDLDKVAPYVVMCQDDILYTKDWLPILASRHRAYSLQRQIGFATGHDAVEHPVREVLGENLFLKDWIRATHMMAPRWYWESLMPIPRFDPETGRVRAKPNDGMGSGVDWWLIRNHENSVVKSGRSNLVVPGLIRHMGYDKSTWLARDLPESDADLAALKIPAAFRGEF